MESLHIRHTNGVAKLRDANLQSAGLVLDEYDTTSIMINACLDRTSPSSPFHGKSNSGMTGHTSIAKDAIGILHINARMLPLGVRCQIASHYECHCWCLPTRSTTTTCDARYVTPLSQFCRGDIGCQLSADFIDMQVWVSAILSLP